MEKVKITSPFWEDGKVVERSVFMYTYMDGTHGFTIDGVGVDDNYHEISEEDFEKYKAIGKDRLYKYLYDNYVTPVIRHGYGFYGCGLFRVNGVPMLMISSGNTCD